MTDALNLIPGSKPEPEASTSAVAQPRATRSRKAKEKTKETPKEPATDATPAKAPAKSAKKPAGRAATKAPAKGRKKRATVAKSEAPEVQRSPSPPPAQPEVDVAQPDDDIVQPEVSPARVEPEPIPPQPATTTASTSVPAATPDDARPPSPEPVPHPSPALVTHPSPPPTLAPPSAPLTPTPQAESSRAAQLREVSDAGPISKLASPAGNGTTSPLPPQGRSVRLQSPPRTAPSAPGEEGPSTAPRQEGEGPNVPSSRQVQRVIDECKKLATKVNQLVEDTREVEQLLEATDMITGETLAEIAVSQMERRGLEEKMENIRENLKTELESESEPEPKPVDRKGKRRARDEDDDEYGGGGDAGRPSRKTRRMRS